MSSVQETPDLRSILFCPLGSPGFAFPSIAVALALRTDSHRVAFVTHRRVAPVLDEQGLAPVAPVDCFDTSMWHQPTDVVRQVGVLERAVRALRPQVLVTSALALGPLIVGERHGIAVVVMGMLTDLLPPGPRRSEFQSAFDACRAAVGLSPRPLDRMRGDLYLARTVPELGLVEHAIGACTWEPPAPTSVHSWLDDARRDGKRIVYVQQARGFGAPGFFRALGDCFHGFAIAASTGRMDESPRDAPPGSLVAPFLPQGAILEHADLAICSGTTSVALGALEHGVPVVTVPAGSEQHDIAALLERIGVGVTVPIREATPPRLAAAAKQALRLDPAPRQKLREAFARIDGPSVAGEEIRRLLSAASGPGR
jgi:UDP:flavonoid glycosyltransferase YjiC (YdhE family)